jgi:hypothetical protein
VEYFRTRGSEALYELRVLSQMERASVAQLLFHRPTDIETTREIARAVKEFSYLKTLPEGFTEHPGDAMAYQCWRTARQKNDLQERSRLIAKGLQFAHSPSARLNIEKLLTDFTRVQTVTAPRIPAYRLESAEELPILIPVLEIATAAELEALPHQEVEGAFPMVRGTTPWVAVPSWQVIRKATFPVGLLTTSDQVGLPGQPEAVLIIFDREQREWDIETYFISSDAETLKVRWFEDQPETETHILGRVLLYLRPPRIFDEEYTKELWQLDE